MLYLIPAPLHRSGLRAAHFLRTRFRRLVKPDLAGISVILHDGDGRLLLGRHSYGPKGWSLLGGGMAAGEDPAAATRREIREELGCELAELQLLSRIQETLAGAPHTAHVFSARVVGEARPDGREIIALRWFAEEELVDAELTRVTRRRLQALGYYSKDS